jgi:hypothetical protein
MRRGLLVGICLAMVLAAVTVQATGSAVEYYETLLLSGRNIILNPDFSQGYEHWMTFGPSGPFAWETTDEALFGNSAAAIYGAGNYDIVYQRLEGLETGVEYVAYLWLKTAIETDECFIRLTLAGYDQGDNVIQYTFSTVPGEDIGGQRGTLDWQLHRITFTLGENVTHIALQATCLGMWDLDEYAFIDGLLLMEKEDLPHEAEEILETSYTN